MSADTLSLISTISFIAAAVCLVLAIFFFIKFKIPSVIGDLSGRNARRSIEQMRMTNEKSGNKSYRPSKTNVERGKLTETMEGMGKKKEKPKETAKEKAKDYMTETGLLAENMAKIKKSEETELLIDQDATGLLVDENATEELDQGNSPINNRTGGVPLTLLEEVILIHTDEVII